MPKRAKECRHSPIYLAELHKLTDSQEKKELMPEMMQIGIWWLFCGNVSHWQKDCGRKTEIVRRTLHAIAKKTVGNLVLLLVEIG